jgi:cell division protein FtsB
MFGKTKKLKEDIERLEHQIKLMQEHIAVQNDEKMSLKKQISKLEVLLDIAENTKRY